VSLSPPIVFDVFVGAALVLLAVGVLFGRNLFRSAVLFVVLGLVMSLAWVRLEAPDIALAEAAIGAGLTGGLMVRTALQLRGRHEDDE
jgi:energy-converting hydrogenase B subunit D